MTPDQLEQLRRCCRDQAAFEQLQQILAVELKLPQVEQQQALFRVIAKIRETLDLETIFKTTATEVRQLLNADRVGVFRFCPQSDWNDGEFVSEDVLSGYSSALAVRVYDHCFGENYSLQYQRGRIQATEDVDNSSLKDCHVEVLARFQIKANLVVPLLRRDLLWGLLCVHQCSSSRRWQTSEIEFVTQVAAHLGVALQQAELLAQTQQQSAELAEALQTLQKAQTQLIQNEKMSVLGQLVAGVAHEINNPVNFIYGNLVYVNRYSKDLLELLSLYQQQNPTAELSDRIQEIDPDFLKEDFPKILSSMQIGAERIRQIVSSLRNFSRLDEAEMKPVDIHEGLDSTLLILQHRLKPGPTTLGVRVIKEYGSLPLVECYASQLNQVFVNILSNAIDALDEQEEWFNGSTDSSSANPSHHPSNQITIRTALASARQNDVPYVVICIADNGPGIPESAQQKLFNPFFTTKPAGKGTGLGLSISYQIIVERHGGILRCTSQPGQGSEFWIEIPIHPVGQRRQSQPAFHPGSP